MDAESCSSIQFEGDSEGIIKAGNNQAERDVIARKVSEVTATSSHCHFNRDFRFNSQALSMQFTPRLTIGGRSWLSIKLATDVQEKALVLWANTTLGLLLHWWHSNKSRPGRSTIGKIALKSLSVLDVTQFNNAQFKKTQSVFAKFSSLLLKPMHEIDSDETRHNLDSDFLGDVLGMNKEIFRPDGPMAVMRAKLAAEPSIRGHK